MNDGIGDYILLIYITKLWNGSEDIHIEVNNIYEKYTVRKNSGDKRLNIFMGHCAFDFSLEVNINT